jgi:hypothetical protein
VEMLLASQAFDVAGLEPSFGSMVVRRQNVTEHRGALVTGNSALSATCSNYDVRSTPLRIMRSCSYGMSGSRIEPI